MDRPVMRILEKTMNLVIKGIVCIYIYVYIYVCMCVYYNKNGKLWHNC
jgi:hypothetical protein